MANLKRLLFCALILALLLAASCKRRGEKNFHPSRLAGKLYSGQSMEAAERELGLMTSDFDVLVDRTPLPSDTRPPYRLLVIAKKNARVENQPGELVLTFFDDRLMTAQFYADNPAAARAAVEADERLSLAGGEAHIAPSTRVWVGRDEAGRSYIGWIDKSLQAEQDAWERRYEQ